MSSDKPHIPLTEKIKSIPEVFGIRVNEEPSYEVIKKDGPFEIRRYHRQLRAKVCLEGMSFDEFRETAFKKLAGYIFGGNRGRANIAMTAPVLQHSGEKIEMTSPVLHEHGADESWTMDFILPEKYNLATVPEPLDPDVRLEQVESATTAVMTYSGNNTEERMHARENELAAWLRTLPQYRTEGEFYCAQYDAPFVIPFLKKNEVQVRVVVTT